MVSENIMFTIITLITTTLRMSSPLIFAGLGGVISEKSGVTNVGLEGMMTIGAFFGVLGSYLTGSAWLGVLFGIVAGGVVALLHAFLSISLRSQQIISGTAINLFSSALASFLIFKIFNKGGQTDIVKQLPYNISGFLKRIPAIGPLLSDLTWFVVAAIVFVFIMRYVLYKTPIGLRIRFVGENPQAADTLGINVYGIRYACVIISGALAGLGGSALSLGTTPVYIEGMVAGRGFMAIAAMIFGNWNPVGTMFACLLFGFAEAFQIQAQGFGWGLPTELFTSIPYIVTVVSVIMFIKKSRSPKALGVPYIRGRHV